MKTVPSIKLPDASDYITNLAYDSVIFGFNGTKLKILVLEYHNTGFFALPGGFIKPDEDLEVAVRRGLEERTGLRDVFLEQFHTFGEIQRTQPAVMRTILRQHHKSVPEDYWMLGRFFSIAYYALINYENVQPIPDQLSDSINWYAVDELPELIFDHNKIVNKALQTLKGNLERKLVGINLLPERFTMKQLQMVYEAVLGEKLRRSSFQRKILGQDILVRHEKLFEGRAHKAPYLYSFIKPDDKKT